MLCQELKTEDHLKEISKVKGIGPVSCCSSTMIKLYPMPNLKVNAGVPCRIRTPIQISLFLDK